MRPGRSCRPRSCAPEHPIFFGYGKTTVPVRYANGPLFQVPEDDAPTQVLMRFTGGDDGVLSGLMRGAAETRRRPAIVDTPVGKGRVVAFATNPCYRWQNHGEFGMLFNAAVLFWNDVPDKSAPATPAAAAPTQTARGATDRLADGCGCLQRRVSASNQVCRTRALPRFT